MLQEVVPRGVALGPAADMCLAPAGTLGGTALIKPLTTGSAGRTATEDRDSEASIGSLLVPERLAVWVWVLGYTALLSSLSILRYGLWIARGDDLGVFEQGLWLLLHGGIHAVTTYTGQPILADGASAVLLLLAPLYAVGGVGFLLVVQSFALGTGYYFIRRLGEDLEVAPWRAHMVGVIYLLFPTVLAVNLYDFHPQALGIPLLFGAICALMERRWASYLIFMCATALIAGAASIVLVGLGLALILQGRASWGGAAVIVGLCSGALASYVAVPWLTHGVGHAWMAVYGSIVPSSGAGLNVLLHHPQALFAWATHLRSWEYVAWLVGPFAGIGLVLKTRLLNTWWLPALILMEVNLVPGIASLTSPFTEYAACVIPFLVVAVLVGNRNEDRPIGRRGAIMWLAPVAVLLLVFCAQQFRSYWRFAPANAAALQAAVAVVPNQAPIIAQDFVLPHLADRMQEWQVASVGTLEIPAGTYVILDAAAKSTLASPAAIARTKALLANTHEVAVIFSSGGVVVGKVLRPISRSG